MGDIARNENFEISAINVLRLRTIWQRFCGTDFAKNQSLRRTGNSRAEAAKAPALRLNLHRPTRRARSLNAAPGKPSSLRYTSCDQRHNASGVKAVEGP